jgi:phage virion morphogenesis protein
LRAEASPDAARVGFASAAVARVAAVHQFGLRDRVTREPNAPEVTYPARVLIEITEASERRILDALLKRLAGPLL